MRPSIHRRCLVSGSFILAAFLTAPARGQAPGAPPEKRNTPPGLAEAIFLRHENRGQPIQVTLSLDLRDRLGAEALTAAQHDPLSPLYGRWVAPEEFQARFGPRPEDLQERSEEHTSELQSRLHLVCRLLL